MAAVSPVRGAGSRFCYFSIVPSGKIIVKVLSRQWVRPDTQSDRFFCTAQLMGAMATVRVSICQSDQKW